MVGPAETVQPLCVEQALVEATRYRSGVRHAEMWGDGVQYPARLGSLAVERVRFDPDYDASRITDGVRADFSGSYEIDDPEAAGAMRQRSMAWLDWLSQSTGLNVSTFAYIRLATTAAEHGDAETVRQIVEDPKRLWLDKGAGTPVSDPAFGQLDRLSTDSIAGKISDIAKIMAVAPSDSAEQVHAAVMPTFRNAVAEFARRDVLHEGIFIELASRHLLAVGTPEAAEQIDRLVAALPTTATKLDILVKLAEGDERFAAAAAEAIAWQNGKASLAEQTLAQYMRPYDGAARNIISYPKDPRSSSNDAIASWPIAAAIVDQISADGEGISAIETSVAYVHSSGSGGSVHGTMLRCARILTGNPHFEFADPQFGFAARSERDEHSYAHGRVTVVDANLPEGRAVIDLSAEPFLYSPAYDGTRFLCRIIQAEKDRRTPAPAVQ